MMDVISFNAISSYPSHREKLWHCNHWNICLTLQTSHVKLGWTCCLTCTGMFRPINLKKMNDTKSTTLHFSDDFYAFYRSEIMKPNDNLKDDIAIC